MRRLVPLLAALLLAPTASATTHPIPGRYGGHEKHGPRAIHFALLRDSAHKLEVFNFRITHNGHTNTYFHSAHLYAGSHFRFFTPEGEVDISGKWTGPGTVEGMVFIQDGHSYHFTAHHLNEVP